MLDLGFKMPLNAATRAFAFLGMRGGGKTYAGAVFAEEFADANIPFVVFDPIDVWWGLKVAEDGKGKGLPIVVFGARHSDIPLTRDMGRLIARAVVRDNANVVISTLGIEGGKTAERQIIADFSEELLTINNTPRHIFIEEAHEYLPQRVMGAMGRTFNAVANLVVMGRNMGIGVTLLNQRAATVNKDVLTQCDTLVAFKNTSPQDRKALTEWMEQNSEPKMFKKFIESLSSLSKGEGYVWSPEFLDVFEKIKIRRRRTFHPDREKIGMDFKMPVLDQIDVADFISKFNSSIKQVEKVLKKDEKKKADEHKLADTHASDGSFVPSYGIVPEGYLSPDQVRALQTRYESEMIGTTGEIRRLSNIIENVRHAISGGIARTATNDESLFAPISQNKIQSIVENLPKYEKELMIVIMKHPNVPFTLSQWAIRANKSGKSSALPTAIRTLIKLDLITKQGNDYIYKI